MASRAQWQKRVAQWKKSGRTAEDFAAQGLVRGRFGGGSTTSIARSDEWQC
jgi:hypothetical protein